ncbi:MAG: translocation/assembly module TamB domain-containing protein [bacterium]|nr:translocation/assembly module TamB domain-containing protein [bacterium]
MPGYWGLLTVEGRNDRIESLFSSFGRGVRSIFQASGQLDISQNTIDMRADFPASDCADFIQALSGRSGILSGDLDGEILVFGKLSAPDVVASMRVANGELLGELTVDKFSLDATVGTEADGRRIIAIPQLSFFKENEYSFTGELTAEPTKGGQFRGYFEGSGDFLDLLQQVDADFTSHGSDSKLRVEVGGTWDAPQFVGGELTVTHGEFTYPPAAPGTLVMNTLLHLNSEGVVDTGRIQVDAGPDYIRLEFLGTDDPRVGMLTPLVIPKPRIELGVMYLSSSNNGIAVRLPGFMKPEWLGRLTTGANEYNGITISGFGDTRLRIGGEVLMRDARFTFPFFSYGGGRIRPVTKWLVDRLYEAEWDLDIMMGNGSHYDVEITGFKDSDLFAQIGDNVLLNTVAEYLDHISVDAIVSPTETPLIMEGALVDSSLRLYGKLGASSGKADYLDQTFWIEKLQAEFDETDIFPIISGRSATYGVDSVGRTVPVYLTIYEIDPESNTRVPFGRFEDVTYVLEADGYPDQEQVLALLGYDLTNFSQGKAEQLLTRTAMTAAKRIWLDPISRRLERATFFDEISLAPGGGVSASIFRQQRESVLRDTLESSGVVKFLKGSNVTVGKYFTKDIFVTYTGELAEAAGEIEGGRLGLIHYWNLQYRVVPLSPDFVLDFAVEYDEASRRRDESVALKYSFVLEP